MAGNASRKTHSGGGPRFGGNRRDWFLRLEGGIPGYQRFRFEVDLATDFGYHPNPF